MLTLSAAVVGRWATNATPTQQLLGDVMLDAHADTPVYVTPKAASQSFNKRTMTPRLALRWQACADALQPCYEAATWDDHGCVFQVDPTTAARLGPICAKDNSRRGTFCPEWLPYCSLRQTHWLRDRLGREYKLINTHLERNATLLKQILTWQWLAPGTVRFLYLQGAGRASTPVIRAFQRLCFTILFNYPKLLNRPRNPQVLRPYDIEVQTHHEWHLLGNDQIVHMEATLRANTHQFERTTDMDRAASREIARPKAIQFHAHPATSRLVQLWGGTHRWKWCNKWCKRHCSEQRTALGLSSLPTDQEVDAEPLSAMRHGLKRLSWTALHRIPGLSAYERQLLYRIKTGKISARSYRDSNLECPEATCGYDTRATSEHIFWACPMAQERWQRLISKWTALGLHFKDHPAVAVFSLPVPGVPVLATEQLRDEYQQHQRGGDPADQIHAAASRLWSYTYPLRSPASPSNDRRIIAGMFNLHILITYAATSEEHREIEQALNGLERLLNGIGTVMATTLAPVKVEYLLFFDGGSRGNPGPGGAGSVLL
ncbi:hypothetical protein FI667_g16661, partial [Globisporangium splendens]